nr:MauE/DoxX family redox-associated membrane protein [Agromyces sp. H66]
MASAVGKLRHPDDLAGWAELGVPAAFRRIWLLRLHPWGELALGLGLAVLGGVLGLLAALVAVALMAAYTLLVWRVRAKARASGSDASCACFGAPTPVTGVTVLRNSWLLLVAAVAASTIWATPLLGGPLAALGPDWGWLVALAAAAFTAAVVVWPPQAAAREAPVPIAASQSVDDDLDYVRTRTPAVPVTLGDGRTANLRTLSMQRPTLLLAVSEVCGSCLSVIERVPTWRALLPEIDVRLLVSIAPSESRLTEAAYPESLHDTEGYVRGSITEWPTPTAVLLGADGLLAGGPESGSAAIDSFIGDVYESLHGERPPTDRPPER